MAATLATSGIKRSEGKSNVTTLDIAKMPTAYYGHTDAGVGPIGTKRTDARCSALLLKDVQIEQAGVAKCERAQC